MPAYIIEDFGGETKSGCYKKLKDVDLDFCPYQIPCGTWKTTQQNGQI